MKVNPYLNFNGQCEAALKFYEQVLGAKTTFKQTWGDSPMANTCLKGLITASCIRRSMWPAPP